MLPDAASCPMAGIDTASLRPLIDNTDTHDQGQRRRGVEPSLWKLDLRYAEKNEMIPKIPKIQIPRLHDLKILFNPLPYSVKIAGAISLDLALGV